MYSRRLAAWLVAAAGLAPGLLAPSLHAQARLDAGLARRTLAAEKTFGARLDRAADPAALARPDGFTYAVDLAQLLTHVTRLGDSVRYAAYRDAAIRELVSDDRSDPYTRGMVAWRYKEGTPRDASGTTEALRLAEALWEGASRFGDTRGRELVVMMLRGYARHEAQFGDTWLIRNYFNFQTRSFATNSYLVDYDPDLLDEVARATGDTLLARVADSSYAAVRKAALPSGLVAELIQPEVLTALPALKSPFFSPGDVYSLLNSCTVAERSARRLPLIGRHLLDFVKGKDREFALYYYGRDGEAVQEEDLGIPGLACLVRLAVKLGDTRARDRHLNDLLHAIDRVEERFVNPYVISEAMLALRAVTASAQATPIPR